MASLSRLAAGLIAASLCVGTAAQAHNQWLKASSTVLSKPQWVTFDGAVSTGLFDVDYVPLNAEGLAITAPDGSSAQAENLLRAKLRTVFDLNLTQTGTYRVAVVNRGAFASYKDSAGQARRWRGPATGLAAGVPADARDVVVTETQGRVETFVTVGRPTPYSLTGEGLELRAVTAPTDLVKGEVASFVMLLDGQPAAGIEVVAIRGGMRYRDQVSELKATTDAAGRFSLTWPEPGMYFLEAAVSDGKTSIAQARQRRVSYSATLEVLP